MPESINTASQGWVYIVVNDLIPNRVKIGYTKRDPIERAHEFISTGTTGTFVVIYQALVYDPYTVEQEVHRRLADFNRGLEWFEICPNRAKEEILAVAGGALHENTLPRWHPSQPEPLPHTKELLAEAKRAAEEERLRKAQQEQAEKDAALAAQLLKAQQEQADKDAAERARVLKEQQDKAAEDVRLAEEAIKRRQAEEELKWQQEEARKRRLALLRTLSPVLLIVAIGYAFLLVRGPFSEKQIALRHDQVLRLGERVDSLAAELHEEQSKLSQLRNDLAKAAAQKPALTKDLLACEADEKRSEDRHSLRQKILKDFLQQNAPLGSPTGPREGMSAETIRKRIATLDSRVTDSLSDLKACVAQTKAARKRLDDNHEFLQLGESRVSEHNERIKTLSAQLAFEQGKLSSAQQLLTLAEQYNALPSFGLWSK